MKYIFRMSQECGAPSSQVTY